MTSLPMQSAATLFAVKPLVVAALHLPDLAVARGTAMSELEDYVLANAEVFAQGGVPALMLQDMTREGTVAAPETLAIMGSLGRLLRSAFPRLQLGIIIQAHDHAAALAVAHATNAGFVRIKVYAGGVMASDGPRDALGSRARTFRHHLRREDIGILADVHDRTTVPQPGVSNEQAAMWAQQLNADGLVLTGSSFDDTLGRVRAARDAGVTVPILIGGGVNDANAISAFSHADGVIVSRSLMKKSPPQGKWGVRWDIEATKRFMDVAREAAAKKV